jgi:hypothetical protein
MLFHKLLTIKAFLILILYSVLIIIVFNKFKGTVYHSYLDWPVIYTSSVYCLYFCGLTAEGTIVNYSLSFSVVLFFGKYYIHAYSVNRQ